MLPDLSQRVGSRKESVPPKCLARVWPDTGPYGESSSSREGSASVLICKAGDGVERIDPQSVPGGPSSTLGTYSTSWIWPSKVRLSVMSRATSG